MRGTRPLVGVTLYEGDYLSEHKSFVLYVFQFQCMVDYELN